MHDRTNDAANAIHETVNLVLAKIEQHQELYRALPPDHPDHGKIEWCCAQLFDLCVCYARRLPESDLTRIVDRLRKIDRALLTEAADPQRPTINPVHTMLFMKRLWGGAPLFEDDGPKENA
ncbi:hypothetical protein HYV74_03415 [Candidatus Uhrbacteria bacterium]|nr:hypothetical protein [Candidatus Uhrbacteria bacterium]